MSLDPNLLATKGDLEELYKRFETLLSSKAASPEPSDEYLTLKEVAVATRVSEKTVKKWIHVGKYDQRGRRIYLLAVAFSPGFLRVPRAALLAYGQSIGFTISDLTTHPRMKVAS